MNNTKFQFTTEFQLDLLKFTVLDREGYKALELYDDTYFTLTSHSFIAYTLKKYYKKKRKVPGKVILIEELQNTFKSREFVNNLTDDDRKEILEITGKLFKGIVKDGDEIIKNAEKFAQFVDLKNEIESVDLLDYDHYESFSRKIQKAISPRLKKIEERGSFLIKDFRYRQLKRQDTSPIVPTPFKQINRLTNAGGYVRGSTLVVLDAAKKWKTGMLVNIALGYLRGKNVLVIDLDNGEDEFMIRMEQSLSNKTKREVLSGEHTKALHDLLKRRKTLKSELIIKRFPALVTTANDIKYYMEYLYREFNIKIDILILDYIAKMGCISGKDSLHERISEAYMDIANLALEKNIIHVWTAQHVNGEANKKRQATIYEQTDIAGALDVSRQVQAIFGLNRTKEEEEAGYLRMEVVEQRDGRKGRALFSVNKETQRARELNTEEIEKYYEDFGEPKEEDVEDPEYKGKKKPRKKDLE